MGIIFSLSRCLSFLWLKQLSGLSDQRDVILATLESVTEQVV